MSRTVAVAGYVIILTALAAYQVAALVSTRLPTIGQAASFAFRLAPVRYAVLAVWLWIGWHLFVR